MCVLQQCETCIHRNNGKPCNDFKAWESDPVGYQWVRSQQQIAEDWYKRNMINRNKRPE